MEIRKEDCMEDEGHQKCVIGKYFVSCPRFWWKWKEFLQNSYEMNATSNLDFKERL